MSGENNNHQNTNPNTNNDKNTSSKEHKFWNTQPVPKKGQEFKEEGPIAPAAGDLRTTPFALPDEFNWVEIDILNDGELKDLYVLLSENYVEDLNSLFRFDYQSGFLKWALCPPGWKKELHVGIRVQSTGQLVAFISAIPCNVRTLNSNVLASEVNYLCVHKKLRSKRLAPVLIKEITRRSNLLGIFQGIYTAGTVLPEPFCVATYYHRPLRPMNLLKSGFCGDYSERCAKSFCAKYMNIQRFDFSHSKYLTRPIKLEDSTSCYDIFHSFVKKFRIKPNYSPEEFNHWIVSCSSNVNYTFVFCEKADPLKIVGFYSFYSIPSSVLLSKHSSDVVSKLQVAYSFYYAFEENSITMEEATNLILKEAYNQGFDVFNALDIGENLPVFEKCNFSVGDGKLNYYIFNWHLQSVEPNENFFLLF